MMSAALTSAAAWQDKELLAQEATLLGTFKSAGMTVIEPDVAVWRKPVLDKVPAQFEEKWGKGTFDSLQKL
jgi:TRAP-type C4-dicarboxylate transport system substrate-binding protein